MFEKILKEEPVYRIKQVKKAFFQDLIESWEEATTLPKNLRQKLSEIYLIPEFEIEKILFSKNKQAIKVLFKLKDDFKIESVLMQHIDGRRTVCVSSQVGCSVGCKFCATGQQGFKRNLSSIEILSQVLFFARLLKKTNKKVSNIVFMGMGEPFLNYDNVIETIKILNDKEGFNLGARHISISTAGIIEGIKKFTKEKLQVNLAISLHAPNNEIREKLMPLNKIYPIEKILTTVNDYIKKTKKRVMFEYLMINEINDTPEKAKELIEVLKKLKSRLYFINLISFNSIDYSQFKPSPEWKIKKFKEILEKAGITVSQRYRFGEEIKAACGQLTGYISK